MLMKENNAAFASMNVKMSHSDVPYLAQNSPHLAKLMREPQPSLNAIITPDKVPRISQKNTIKTLRTSATSSTHTHQDKHHPTMSANTVHVKNISSKTSEKGKKSRRHYVCISIEDTNHLSRGQGFLQLLVRCTNPFRYAQIVNHLLISGKITDLKITPSGETQDATVTFEKETAAKTALLLDNTQLGATQVQVTSATGSTDDDGSHFTKNTERDSDDITQEEKPRSRIVAEYLAHGYVVGDQAIQRAIDLDQKHGVSTRFMSTIQSMNEKYVLSVLRSDLILHSLLSRTGQLLTAPF